MDNTEGTGERVGVYRVVRKLASGGTSNVLLAKAEGPHGFERTVVLKLLLPEYKHDAEFKGMFAREATAYARLSHPSIVRLYDFFANDDQLVMVLEYIDGPPLSRLRGMLRTVGHQFDDTTALYVGASIFDALAAAHGAVDETGEPAPVIHRDVNPSNVLIAWDGHVKLADFSVAKVTGASHQSRVGLIRGTFGYMAPEQVKGEAVTPRADVYAGAIILWEMLTKRRAFIRGALPEIEVLRELAEPRIISIDGIRPDLDKSVRDAITRALEPRGDKRTITAEEMSSVLRAIVPAAEGRETLVKALGSVRLEPRPSATSIPPPVRVASPEPGGVRPVPRAPMLTMPGLAPRATPPPLPAVSVSRPPPPRPASKKSEPPPPTSPASSSSRGLAALLEPSESNPPPNPGRGGGAPSEKPRFGPALSGLIPGGRGMKDAIDEILRDIPSNVPPNLFPKTEPPGGTPFGAVGGDDALADPFAREIGQLPAAPPPLDPSVPLTLGGAIVAKPPSSFPPLDRTLAIERAPGRPADVLAPNAGLASTVALQAHPPQPLASPPTARLAAFGPAAAAPAPNLASSPPAMMPLGGMSSAAPPPFVQSQPAMPGPGSYPPPHVPPPAAPAQRRSSAVAITGVLLVAILAGGAGTVAYMRRQRPRRTTTASAIPSAAVSPTASPRASSSSPSSPLATSAIPAAAQPTTSTLASASASASARAAASPSASAAPSAAAPASASPSTSASASASVTAAADLPPGMGRVRTTGAAGGRRIFVDERVVGQTPETVVVKCGVRSVKLGSSGVARSVDVPCAGEITVGDR